ncbi:NADPH:quinone oxidoreductase family protein [Acinetobacter sp. R933-2]|uniref:NADPH:quinone oxidoreductase family protein n=1 Tax=Acinetobacter sp. R933-2 TaxID=2746728 RepID=UPI002578C38C|nr:NADPH:quinone oxidoreductase family protein [Acinetobacter sp. R933-2]MDM1247708.1 NADPH:quinone oxidoreductase family protein [Acinetobacter sp. R933-2]
MKAVTVRAFSDNSSDHQFEEQQLTPLQQGQVRIAMKATSVNYPDLLMMSGQYQSIPEFPFTPGMDGAGVIAELSVDVKHLKVGDHILVNAEHGCYAQQLQVDAAKCLIIPEDLPFADAAALGLVYQTAYFALVHRADLKAGETVLVNGAGGGIGMATVQIAKGLGAKIIAVVRNQAQADLVQQSGADQVVFVAENISKNCIRDQLKNTQIDILIDPVGGALFDESLRALSWCGRAVIVGFASGQIPVIKANYVLLKNITVTGVQWTSYQKFKPELVQQAHEHIIELYRAGHVQPLICGRYPIQDFAQALEQFKLNKQGKIIIEI